MLREDVRDGLRHGVEDAVHWRDWQPNKATKWGIALLRQRREARDLRESPFNLQERRSKALALGTPRAKRNGAYRRYSAL
jgi:hypothetical protein